MARSSRVGAPRRLSLRIVAFYMCQESHDRPPTKYVSTYMIHIASRLGSSPTRLAPTYCIRRMMQITIWRLTQRMSYSEGVLLRRRLVSLLRYYLGLLLDNGAQILRRADGFAPIKFYILRLRRSALSAGSPHCLTATECFLLYHISPPARRSSVPELTPYTFGNFSKHGWPYCL